MDISKEVKDLYSENFKTLKTEVEDGTIGEKIYHVHKLKMLMLLIWPYYPGQSIDTVQSLAK